MPSRRCFLAAGAACVAAPFASACQNALGPSKIDHDWEVQDRGRFTFYSRPASFAARSVDQLFAFLDYQYDATAAMLDVRYTASISLFLHTSAADAGLPSDHSGVAYPDTQAVRAVCVPPIDGNLMVLLSHECNHVIANNSLGAAGTSFMNEGTASWTAVSDRRMAHR